MSFQDFGKPGAGRRDGNNKAADFHSLTPIAEKNSGGWNKQGGGGAPNSYAQVSDGVLQYRRNVGILEKISEGLATDNAVSETQYKVQVDVLKQLGAKIEKQLQAQETKMNSMPRTEAARVRATHIKLSRDFRRVEATFKTIQLEAKRKRAQKEARNRKIHDSPIDPFQSDQNNTEDPQLRMQLQEDKINEEIMREREEEIRNINRGMHQVNEIYKDLAHIVASQQEQVDQVEEHMEEANKNADSGLKQIEKASAKADSSQCIIS